AMGDPQTGEPTAQEKLAALENPGSNQGTVSAIETGGHVISAGYVAEGAVATYTTASAAAAAQGLGASAASAAGWGAVRCFVGRVAVPLAGAMAGAYIADKVGADEGLLKIAEFFGAERQAQPGPEPAHLEHKIAHNHAFGGI